MPNSTSTLLSVTNEVLRAVGERPVLALGTVTTDRVTDCVKQALRDLEAIHTWDWLYKTIPALSWEDDAAELGDIQRLFGVGVGDLIKGFTQLTYKDILNYDGIPSTSYIGTTDGACFFTYSGYGQVRVTPSPADNTARARIRFYVLSTIQAPTTATSVFTGLPERFVPLLVKRTCYHFVMRHLDDLDSANRFEADYMELVQQYRSNERKRPQNTTNMYRRGVY